jgi:hypothetical protein
MSNGIIVGTKRSNHTKKDNLDEYDSMGHWDEYTSETSQAKAYPENEYEHAASLLEEDNGKRTFSNLVDKMIILSNIKDNKILEIERRTAGLLVNFFDMAQREPELRSFFLIRYHEWRTGLLLTRTKDGNERRLQALVGTKYSQPGEMEGYDYDWEEADKGEGGLANELKGLKNMLPKRKKRQMW